MPTSLQPHLDLQPQLGPTTLLNLPTADNTFLDNQGLRHMFFPNQSESLSTIHSSKFSTDLFSSTKFYKYKDLTSPNQQFLSPDKNPRKIANLGFTNNSTYPLIPMTRLNLPTNLSYPLHTSLSTHQGSSLTWAGANSLPKQLSNSLTSAPQSSPVLSNNGT